MKWIDGGLNLTPSQISYSLHFTVNIGCWNSNLIYLKECKCISLLFVIAEKELFQIENGFGVSTMQDDELPEPEHEAHGQRLWS